MSAWTPEHEAKAQAIAERHEFESADSIVAAIRKFAEPLLAALAPDATIPSQEDPLHPYGRCTCAGEGWCWWHRGICPACMGDGGGYYSTCEMCKGAGKVVPRSLTPNDVAEAEGIAYEHGHDDARTEMGFDVEAEKAEKERWGAELIAWSNACRAARDTGEPKPKRPEWSRFSRLALANAQLADAIEKLPPVPAEPQPPFLDHDELSALRDVVRRGRAVLKERYAGGEWTELSDAIGSLGDSLDTLGKLPRWKP